MTTVYVADTGVFVRCGGPDKDKFHRLRRALQQAGVSLRIPQRVYEELGGDSDAGAYPAGNIPYSEGFEEGWIAFFEQFGIDTSIADRPDAGDIDGAVHYVLFPATDGIDVEWVDGNPVIPVAEAVEQMVENRPAYEPALEIISEEYDVDIDTDQHGQPPTADQT